MRHAKKRLQLNRFTSWHEATLKSLARNTLIHQSIKTSLHKAKAVRPLVEDLISLAKKNTLAARRRAFEILGDHKMVSLLFNEIGPRFEKRPGGFTRIIHFKRRRGDNVQIVIFELTEIKKRVKKVKKVKEVKEKETEAQGLREEAAEEKKPKTATAVETSEKPPIEKKPQKKFFGGIRNIFKKERDSL